MIRHLIRQVVKFGQVEDFMKASKALNEVGASLGMPAYRVYHSHWGTFNEVFSEAEYESAEELNRLMDSFGKDPVVSKAFGEMTSHLVDGEAHDYLLAERVLD